MMVERLLPTHSPTSPEVKVERKKKKSIKPTVYMAKRQETYECSTVFYFILFKKIFFLGELRKHKYRWNQN